MRKNIFGISDRVCGKVYSECQIENGKVYSVCQIESGKVYSVCQRESGKVYSVCQIQSIRKSIFGISDREYVEKYIRYVRKRVEKYIRYVR